MRNLLQEQLLKAGLVNKAKAAQVVREQAKRLKGKAPATPSAEQVEAKRSQLAKAERDRALAAERNARTQVNEALAQVRQIIAAHKIPREGELTYRFNHGDRIRDVLVTAALRSQLATGTLVIACQDDTYELLPRVAADKVYSRAPELIVLDHGQPSAMETGGEDAEHYRQFEVPDDLIW
ncbi:MAG: DUF2058 domain-containing protein [Rhodanobacter sp.]